MGDYPENLVNLEHKDHLDHLEIRDLLVSPETEVTQVFLDLLECRVIVVQLAWLENLENKEDQVLQGTVVHPEILDLSDQLDRLGKVVQKDPLEKSVHQDVMEQLDQLDLLEDREFPDHQVFQVSKERADLVVMQEHLVFKDLQDQKVAVGHLDQPEFVEIKELQENVEIEEKKVIKVSLVFLDYLVHQANKETRVFLDNLDQLVLEEKLDLVVFLVLMVFKDLWDLLVHLVHVVHLVLMVLRVHLVHQDPQDLQDLLVHPLTILTSNLQDTRDHKMMRLP